MEHPTFPTCDECGAHHVSGDKETCIDVLLRNQEEHLEELADYAKTTSRLHEQMDALRAELDATNRQQNGGITDGKE